jgi:hypothetical protein
MNCYAESYSLLANLGGIARLCHGIATQSVEPRVRIGHAWIEVDTPSGIACIDHQAPGMWIPQQVYYDAGKVEPETVRRRTPDEAKAKLDETGHCGPWDAEIDAAAHWRKEQ